MCVKVDGSKPCPKSAAELADCPKPCHSYACCDGQAITRGFKVFPPQSVLIPRGEYRSPAQGNRGCTPCLPLKHHPATSAGGSWRAWAGGERWFASRQQPIPSLWGMQGTPSDFQPRFAWADKAACYLSAVNSRSEGP